MNSALRNLNWLSCLSTPCEKKVTEQTIEQAITLFRNIKFSAGNGTPRCFKLSNNMYTCKKKKIPSAVEVLSQRSKKILKKIIIRFHRS